MSRTFAHDYEDGGGRYSFNYKKWEPAFWELGVDWKTDKRCRKHEIFRHHGKFKSKLYKPTGRCWWLKPPSWCTRENVTAPYRAAHRDMLRNVIKATSFELLEEVDIPKFPGRLKNADWEWT